jgi:hypothetical protein
MHCGRRTDYRKPQSQSSRQAINRGLVYAERPRDVANRLAFREQLRCYLRLIAIELPWPAETNATLSCCIDPQHPRPTGCSWPVGRGDYHGKRRRRPFAPPGTRFSTRSNISSPGVWNIGCQAKSMRSASVRSNMPKARHRRRECRDRAAANDFRVFSRNIRFIVE